METAAFEISIDGEIGEEEYPAKYHDMATGMDLYMMHDSRWMYVGMVSAGTGWVAVGFGPVGTGMDGADIIIGFVDDASESFHIADHIGVEHIHVPDTQRGGEDNIVLAAGTQDEGTTIEFIIPIDSGDDFDQSIEIGTPYGIILAQSETADDFESYHSARFGGLNVVLSAQALSEIPPPKRTHLYVEFTEIQSDDVLGIHYVLVGEDGKRLENTPIDIFLNYSMGVARWDTILTDQEGEAHTELVIRRSGLYETEAVYNGDSRFLPSSYTYAFSRYVEYESIPENPYYNWGVWGINRPHDNHDTWSFDKIRIGSVALPFNFAMGNIFTSEIRPETPFSLIVLSAVYVAIIIAWSFILFSVYSIFRIGIGSKEK